MICDVRFVEGTNSTARLDWVVVPMSSQNGNPTRPTLEVVPYRERQAHDCLAVSSELRDTRPPRKLANSLGAVGAICGLSDHQQPVIKGPDAHFAFPGPWLGPTPKSEWVGWIAAPRPFSAARWSVISATSVDTPIRCDGSTTSPPSVFISSVQRWICVTGCHHLGTNPTSCCF